MTINFPKTLPYPTVQGYAIKPGEAIVRTEMEAGPARQRRRYTQTPSRSRTGTSKAAIYANSEPNNRKMDI